MNFTEERLEQAIVEILGQEGYPHVLGRDIAHVNAGFAETDFEKRN